MSPGSPSLSLARLREQLAPDTEGGANHADSQLSAKDGPRYPDYPSLWLGFEFLLDLARWWERVVGEGVAAVGRLEDCGCLLSVLQPRVSQPQPW